MSIRNDSVTGFLVVAITAHTFMFAAPAAAADPNAGAAILATQILLTPACNDDRCEDADHRCKQCARPLTTGAEPKASDALSILRAAVGQMVCARCICDVDNSGSVVATDALLTLRRAVGQSVTLGCPQG